MRDFHLKKGKDCCTFSHYQQVQAECNRWYQAWPKQAAAAEAGGFIAPRLPTADELPQILEDLLGQDKGIAWLRCFKSAYV